MSKARRATAALAAATVTAGLLLASCAIAPPLRAPVRAPDLPTPDELQAQQEHMLESLQRSLGKVQVQEPRSAEGVQVVLQTGHTQGISSIAVNPQGRLILTADIQGTVKLWDVASRREIRTFLGDIATVAEFSRDGERILLHGAMARTRVFDASSGRELSTHDLVSADGRVGVDTKRTIDTHYASRSRLSVTDLASGGSVELDTPGEPVAMSADGATLLVRELKAGVLSVQDDFVVWDLKRRVSGLRVPAASLRGAPLLSADGRWLVAQNRDCSLDVSGTHAEAKRQLAPATSACATLAGTTPFVLSPDGRWLARRSLAAIEVYETAAAGRPLEIALTATSPGRSLEAIRFSPDGRYLVRLGAAGGGLHDAQAQIWELPGGRPLSGLAASAIALSSDGKFAAIAHANLGVPVLVELASGHETSLGGSSSSVSDIALTADGRLAVAGSLVGGARLWDLATGQLLHSFECPGGAAAASVDLGITGGASTLATACTDGSAWLWELNTGRQLRALAPAQHSDAPVPAVVRFSTDALLLAVAQGEHVSVWDLAGERKIWDATLPRTALPPQFENPTAQSLDPEALARIPQNARDAIEQSQRLASSVDPKELAAMGEAQHRITAIAFQPQGRLLAIGRPHELELWDPTTGQRVRQLSGGGTVNASALGQQGAAAANSSPSRLLSLFGAARGAGPTTVIVADDPSAMLDAVADQYAGVNRSLAFSADGRVLFADGRRWEVATGRKLRPPRPAGTSAANLLSFASSFEQLSQQGLALASPDGLTAAYANGRLIRLVRLDTEETLGELIGHTADVQSLAFTRDGKRLVSGGADGSMRLWDVSTRHEVAALFALGGTDFFVVTPDQYYRASKSRLQGVSFRVRDQLYPFEQFDLRLNRPDIVLERLGHASPAEIESYRRLHERRLKKMGFTESMLSGELHLPTAEILNGDPPVATDATVLKLKVRATDETSPLDRINAFVNDVPVFGAAGLPLADRQARQVEQELELPLVAGQNEIQISALNQQGVESLRQTVYTVSAPERPPPDVYIVAIGVSQYRNHAYDLRFAAKDAHDLIAAYAGASAQGGVHGQVHVLDLTDEKATRAGIRAAKQWLRQARVDDLAIVFAAGHGMTDARQEYYFGTYDIDPAQPQLDGLAYEEFEALLDGIQPLKKLLLIDTCFSGEIDRDEPVELAQAPAGADGAVRMRAFKSARGVTLVANPSSAHSSLSAPASLTGDVQHFQELFADLRRGTGAVVISSASGDEYALEGEQWRNGVFTYALLSGLKDGRADANRDGLVTVSELQAYVIEAVRRLTAGGQNPTVRRENLAYDFVVY